MQTTQEHDIGGNIQARPVLATSIGKKLIMAVTGAIILGWVTIHMLGNLQVFLGQEKINVYAQLLKEAAALTWAVRIGLAIAVILHVVTGVQLYIRNRASRPSRYAYERTVQASAASRSMIISGLLIFFFAAYHLMHFTFQTVDPTLSLLTDAKGRHDVYSMIILSFQQPLISITYMAAMAMLALHISHGGSSLFQSLGLASESTLAKLKLFSWIVAVFLFLGFSAVPIAVLTGQLMPIAGYSR